MKKYLLNLIFCLLASTAMIGQVIVSADFNSTFPADWMSTGNATDGGWAVHDATSVSSQYWQAVNPEDGTTFIGTNDDACNCDKSQDRLVTPAMDLTAAPDFIFLSFDKQYFARGFQGAVERLTLEVSYDGGATWSEIYEIPGNTLANWQTEVINISDLDRVASVNLAFRYNDGGGWLFGAALDNIRVYSPNANDARLNLDASYAYVDMNNFNLAGSISNVGGENITSIDITYDLGNGPMTETISGLDIAPLESAPFEIPLSLDAPEAFNISVSASNPSGVVDQDMSNNEGVREVIGVSNPPSKMVFVEESTGTWCPWCPRGAVFMDLMEENYAESFAGVAVHVGLQQWPDPMEVPSYASVYNQTVSGYPTLVVDRFSNPGIPGPPSGTIQSMIDYGAQLRDFTRNRPSPIGLSVNAEIDGETNQMMIDIEATAHSNLDNQIFSLVTLITEDHVTGDGFDYRQANNYAGGANGALMGWELLGNPASGNDIEYNHTLRAAPDGYSGSATIIPSSIMAGDTYSYSLTYDIPAEFDNTNLNVAVVAIDLNNDGAALNAGMVREVALISSIDEIDELAGFNVYPNPVVDQLNVELEFTESLDYSVHVMDVLGNKIMDLGQFKNNRIDQQFNVAGLSSGMYLLAVRTDAGQNVMKFTKL